MHNYPLVFGVENGVAANSAFQEELQNPFAYLNKVQEKRKC